MSAATECPDCGFALNLQAHLPPECLLCGYVEGEDLVEGDRPPQARRTPTLRRPVRRRPPMPWRFPRNRS